MSTAREVLRRYILGALPPPVNATDVTALGREQHLADLALIEIFAALDRLAGLGFSLMLVPFLGQREDLAKELADASVEVSPAEWPKWVKIGDREVIANSPEHEAELQAEGSGIDHGPADGAPAWGSITFSAQPAEGATISIGGVVFTFVGKAPVGNQIMIGKNLAETVANAVAALNDSTVGEIAAHTYSAEPAGTTIKIVSDEHGPGGNRVPMAISTMPVSNAVLSGPMLSGGSPKVEPQKAA